MIMREDKIIDFVNLRNKQKILFTAGPAALLTENLTGLRPCFGRGDEDYIEVEERVLNNLKNMTGHSNLVRMQGSASLALEVAVSNFLFGKVLIIDTGFYSARLVELTRNAQITYAKITEIKSIPWNEFHKIDEKFDWVLSCYTETSEGLKIPIEFLEANTRRISSRLMLDATASVGLENGHEKADVIAYSSCKGLFGLTGGAFIASHEYPSVDISSFYLNWNNHNQRLMTGPYHAILSLDEVLQDYSSFRAAVVNNKKIFTRLMSKYLMYPPAHQPLLCTKINAEIRSKNPAVVLYAPRGSTTGSVICHLGEAHLKNEAKGEILSQIEILQ
jgi:2-aminoethylphosphonate-pyruvate transaminase